MRMFILGCLAVIYLLSCDNSSKNTNAIQDTSATQSTLIVNEDTVDLNDTTFASVRRDSIPYTEAITMIKNFQTNTYRLQMARLDSRKLRQLTRSSDSVRLWMAVKPNNTITMILQQKKKMGADIKFLYYDLTQSSKITTTDATGSLCPEPPNCDVLIDL